MQLEINTEITHVPDFANAIAANSKANGGQLTPLYDRIEMWINSYARIVSLAGQLAATDAKGMWKYGDTVDHCPSCSGYAGRVYRNSVWRKFLEPFDLLPKGKGLACGGWRCDCSIIPTSEPVSSGRPPIITKVAHTHDTHQAHSHHAETSANGQRIHSGNGAGRSENHAVSGEGLQRDAAHMGA